MNTETRSGLLVVDAERSSGCIEIIAGLGAESMESLPIRVYKADSGETVVSCTYFRSGRAGVTDQDFETVYRRIVEDVWSLLDRFGGGDISTGLPDGSSFDSLKNIRVG